MTDRRISVRIGLTGEADVKRALDDVTRAGAQGFNNIAQKMRDAATQGEAYKTTLKQIAEAAKLADAGDPSQLRAMQIQQQFSLQQFGIGRDTISAKDSAQALEELQAGAAKLRAEINPLGVAQEKLNADLETANTLYARGAITTEELAAAQALARKNFELTSDRIRRFGNDSKLANFALQNIGYQLNDIAVGLASGQSPFRVLTQQGLQIVQIFGANAGVKQVLSGVWQTIASLITPARLVSGGIATIGVVLASAYKTALDRQNDVERGLSGIGRAAGITASQIEKIATESGASANISISAARDIELAFARTGKITGDQFGNLVVAAKRLSATTGEDLKTAVDEIAKAFSDPSRGAEDLDKKLGFLDDRTKHLIDTLSKQGDRLGAQKVLQEALLPSLDDAAAHTTLWARAWDDVARAYSNFWDSFGRTLVNNPTLDETIKGLQDKLRQGALLTPEGQVISSPTQADQSELNFLLLQRFKRDSKAANDAANIEASRRSRELGDLARNIVPGFADRENIGNLAANLGSGLASPEIRAKVGDLDLLKDALNRVSEAQRTWLDPAQRAAELNKVEIAALKARTPEELGAIARQRTAIEIAGQYLTAEERRQRIGQAGALATKAGQQAIDDQTKSLQVNADSTLNVAEAWLKDAAAAQTAMARREALNESIQNGVDVQARQADILKAYTAQQTEAGAKIVSDMTAETSVRGKLNEMIARGQVTTAQAAQQLQLELTLRPFLIAHALAEGEEKKRLTDIINELTAAVQKNNAEMTKSDALGIREGQEDEIDVLQTELSLLGATQEQRNKTIAVIRAEQDLRKRGIDINSEEGRAIIANAGHIQELSDSLGLAQAAMDDLRQAGEQSFDRFNDLIKDGKFNLKYLRDAAISVARDILAEFEKLAVANPLKNLLFGGSNPTLGDTGGAAGGLIGSLFGALLGTGTGGTATGNFDFAYAHSGGHPGIDPLPKRSLPASLIATAPRFHLGIDEVPAVLLKGERVLNRQETAEYNKGWQSYRGSSMPAGQGGTEVHVHVHIDGARGSAEIEEAVAKGVAQSRSELISAFSRYDAGLERRVLPMAKRAMNDPYYAG